MQKRIVLLLLILIVSTSFAEAWEKGYNRRATIEFTGNYTMPVLRILNISNISCTFKDCRDFVISGNYIHTLPPYYDFDGDGNAETVLFINDEKNQISKYSNFSLSDNTISYRSNAILKSVGPCYKNSSAFFCPENPQSLIESNTVQVTFFGENYEGLILAFSYNNLSEYTSFNCLKAFEIGHANNQLILDNVSFDSQNNQAIFSFAWPLSKAGILQNFSLNQIIELGRKPAYVFDSSDTEYIFFNPDMNDFYIYREKDNDLILICSDKHEVKNYLNDIFVYVIKGHFNQTLETLASVEDSLSHPPIITKIETYMVDYIDLEAIDFTPVIRSVKEGEAISNIKLVLEINKTYADIIKTNHQIIPPLTYTRGDYDDTEQCNYSYENGQYELKVEDYVFNVSIENWPWEAYYGEIVFNNLNLKDKFSHTMTLDPKKGYITKYYVENNILYIKIEPDVITLISRFFWPFMVPLLIFLIIKYKDKTRFDPTKVEYLIALLIGGIFVIIPLAGWSGLILPKLGIYPGVWVLIFYICLLSFLIFKDKIISRIRKLHGKN